MTSMTDEGTTQDTPEEGQNEDQQQQGADNASASGQQQRGYSEDYVRKLRGENRATRLKLEERIKADDASKTEAQKITERLAQVERDLASERAEKLRLKVANERSLGEWADLLQGETREELEDNAEKLQRRLTAARANGAQGRATNAGQHASGSAPGKSSNDLLRDMLTKKD